MAFNRNSVQVVIEACLEMQYLDNKRQQAQISTGDYASETLTDTERDALRARWLTRINALRGNVKAETATW